MAEKGIGDTPDATAGSGSNRVVVEDNGDHGNIKGLDTPDIHNVSIKIQRAKDAYWEFEREEQPSSGEIFLWYMYGLCSYFIQTVLVPIVFPLIISQVKSPLPQSLSGWGQTSKGLRCTKKQLQLYQALTAPSIPIKEVKYSPLEWTAISWGAGILISAPILSYLTRHLDHTHHHHLIFGLATAIGSLFCLPAGFFHVTWIFPPYIAAIIAANILCNASHTRHLGLLLRAFHKPNEDHRPQQIANRRSIASWLSMNATAAGCLGAAIIAAFTYHMLHPTERVVSLWVVSIFSGLKWLCGAAHAFTATRPCIIRAPSSKSHRWTHLFSIFKYSHAVGGVASVFLSSFTTTCIFAGGLLYVVGQLCLKPEFVLFAWLIYFIFPLFSLPLSHPLQQLLKTDAVRMQLLGFLVSAATSAVGFYYRDENWQRHHILILVGLQSTAAGILYAFGRVLVLDCTPAGKEGSFSVWFAWVRAVGTCGGFAVASAFPGNVSKSFSVSFFTSAAGIVLLIFGKISSSAGAVAAGHVREDGSEGDLVVQELDKSSEGNNSLVHMQIC